MPLYKLKSGKHIVVKGKEKKVYLPGDVIDCTERFLHGALNKFEKIGESPEKEQVSLKQEEPKIEVKEEPKTEVKKEKKKKAFTRK